MEASATDCIRVETVDDEPSVDAVITAAFGQTDEAELVRSLRTDPAWLPELSLVALQEGVVVGHVLFTELHIGEGVGLALAPLSVDPSHQGEGIGSSLVRSGLSRAAQLGYSTVVVVGDPEYYRRFGFVPATELGITGPFGDIDAFQALFLDAADALTGMVRYPPPFGISE